MTNQNNQLVVQRYPIEVRKSGVLIAYLDFEGDWHCLEANKKLVIQAINEQAQRQAQVNNFFKLNI